MAYTLPTAEDIIALTGSKLSEAVIGMLINSAEQMVLPCLDGMTDDNANAVLMFLSAHLVAVSGGTTGSLTSDKLGDAQKSWSKPATGEGLAGTVYGQQALLLDKCGCLLKLGKPVARIEFV